MDIVFEKSLAFIGENCLVSIDLEQKIAQHFAMMTRQFFALKKRQNYYICLFVNAKNCRVIIAKCCAIFCSRSMLTKQFSPIKAKLFSKTISISVLDFKVNGNLRKSSLRNFFCT